ncbi:hypothetical protein ACFX1S_041395 [Malus domestica]
MIAAPTISVTPSFSLFSHKPSKNTEYQTSTTKSGEQFSHSGCMLLFCSSPVSPSSSPLLLRDSLILNENDR